MRDKGRRQFLTSYFREEFSKAAGSFLRGMNEAREEEQLEEFFGSYESSYAITLAYPDEIVHESARRAGIPFEGREKADVVRDLVRFSRGA